MLGLLAFVNHTVEYTLVRHASYQSATTPCQEGFPNVLPTYLPELQAAQGSAQNSSPEIVLIGHEHTVQRVPRYLDDVSAERVDDVHEVRVVAVDDLQNSNKPEKARFGPRRCHHNL